MFTAKQLEKYADVLIWGLKTAREKEFKKGDIILIKFELDAIELAQILQRKIYQLEMHPIMQLTPTPQMELNLYEKGAEEQLNFIAPGEKELYSSIQGLISLRAPASITHLKSVDSNKIAAFTISRKFMRDLLDESELKGDLGWTLCMLPTLTLAEAANLTVEEYANQIINACLLNTDDPVAGWKSIFDEAMLIKKKLNSMEIVRYRIKTVNMDLSLAPGDDRNWIGISGHNIPSFELFLSPDYRSAEGSYYANQPSFRNGNLVEEVLLTFKEGRVIQSSAKTGEAFLQAQLAMDEGACRIGEFSLTDRRFSKIDKFMANTLFDENYGGEFGNCHIAVGASYINTYSKDASRLTPEQVDALGFNKSALHWDLVNTEDKTVTAVLKDGTEVVIYKSGEFVL